MLDGLASSFEEFLFGFGRHFWNVVGVAGVVAIAVGGISLGRVSPRFSRWCDWIREDTSFDCRGKTTVLPSGAKLTSSTNTSHELYGEYLTYTRSISDQEEQKLLQVSQRAMSSFVMLWGLASIASVSVFSSVLAVERNSRSTEGVSCLMRPR